MNVAGPWQWFLRNWDVATALALAVVFAVLGAAGGASDDLVRGSTLAVLGLIAAALTRVRSERESSDVKVTAIQTTLTAVAADVSAIESGTPWRILDCELVWDLATRDFAHFKKTREMHFYRNDVMSLHDWYG